MVDSFGYKLPSELLPDIVCHKVYIPDAPEYRQAFYSALLYFAKWVAWERDEAHGGAIAAKLWKDANNLTFDNWDEVCDAPECPECPETPECPTCIEDDLLIAETLSGVLSGALGADYDCEEEMPEIFRYNNGRIEVSYTNGYTWEAIPEYAGTTGTAYAIPLTGDSYYESAADDAGAAFGDMIKKLYSLLSPAAFAASDADDFILNISPTLTGFSGNSIDGQWLRDAYDLITGYATQGDFDDTVSESLLDTLAGRAKCLGSQVWGDLPEITSDYLNELGDVYTQSADALDESIGAALKTFGVGAIQTLLSWARNGSAYAYQGLSDFPCGETQQPVSSGWYSDNWRTITFNRFVPTVDVYGKAGAWGTMTAQYTGIMAVCEWKTSTSWQTTGIYPPGTQYVPNQGYPWVVGPHNQVNVQPGAHGASAIDVSNPITFDGATVLAQLLPNVTIRGEQDATTKDTSVIAGTRYAVSMGAYESATPTPPSWQLSMRWWYYITV